MLHGNSYVANMELPRYCTVANRRIAILFIYCYSIVVRFKIEELSNNRQITNEKVTCHLPACYPPFPWERLGKRGMKAVKV